MNEDDLAKIGFKILAKRNYSKSELLKKLLSKGFEEVNARDFVNECAEKGYINENDLVENIILSAKNNRYLSRRAVKWELQKRFIDKYLIDELMDKLYSETDEWNVAQKLYVKFQKMNIGLPREKFVRKLAGTMERKGFPSPIIGTTINKYFKNNQKDG